MDSRELTRHLVGDPGVDGLIYYNAKIWTDFFRESLDLGDVGGPLTRRAIQLVALAFLKAKFAVDDPIYEEKHNEMLIHRILTGLDLIGSHPEIVPKAKRLSDFMHPYFAEDPNRRMAVNDCNFDVPLLRNGHSANQDYPG